MLGSVTKHIYIYIGQVVSVSVNYFNHLRYPVTRGGGNGFSVTKTVTYITLPVITSVTSYQPGNHTIEVGIAGNGGW